MTDGNQMSHEEKIKYIAIAANICRLALDNAQMDLLISLYDLILEKGGEADVRSILKVQADVHERSLTPSF